MDTFFNNIIITQEAPDILAGFAILFIGTVINFALSGLSHKNSQKISDIITTGTLTLAPMCTAFYIFAFLTPNGMKTLDFFFGLIKIGSLEMFLAAVLNIAVLFAFLTSLKYLKKLRHKQHYFNTLFLCSALGINTLVCSNGFAPFFLSLEILSVCAAFIILGFKNKKIFFSAYNFLIYSLSSSALIILSYALSDGFASSQSVLLAISKVLFVFAILFKGSIILNLAKSQNMSLNFPAFVFLNTVWLAGYSVAIFKSVRNIAILGSFEQIFFILFFIATACAGTLKLTRADNFRNYIFSLNGLNYSVFALLSTVWTPATHSCAIFLLLNTLVVNCALLSAATIYKANTKDNSETFDFCAIYHINPQFSTLLSAVFFIAGAIIPSGVLAAIFFFGASMCLTGLWCLVAVILIALCYGNAAISTLNFVQKFYNKPPKHKLGLKTFKKRTKLNCFILSVCIILSFAFCILSTNIVKFLISFQ